MWIIYSLCAALSFSGIFVIFKALELRSVSTFVSLAWVFIVAALLYVGHNAYTKESLKVSGTVLYLVLAAGVLSYIGNAFQFRATALAPNPGYAIAVVSVQVVLVTVLSLFLFGSDFSTTKGLGVLLSLCGVILLSL